MASQADTDELLGRAASGDTSATEQLLARHRARLRQMVAVRIDSRLTARLDPSDVVQDALAEAARKLPDYLQHRPLPFYPWLRQIAWERLVQLHRRHIQTQKRSINRETRDPLQLSDQSAIQLADRLAVSGTSPSQRVIQNELRKRLREALERMPPHDREILLLWYLEQLSPSEIAAILKLSEAAVKSRHRRALDRLLRMLSDQDMESHHD